MFATVGDPAYRIHVCADSECSRSMYMRLQLFLAFIPSCKLYELMKCRSIIMITEVIIMILDASSSISISLASLCFAMSLTFVGIQHTWLQVTWTRC